MEEGKGKLMENGVKKTFHLLLGDVQELPIPSFPLVSQSTLAFLTLDYKGHLPTVTWELELLELVKSDRLLFSEGWEPASFGRVFLLPLTTFLM